MEEKIKDYILKQYESIGNLHNTLNVCVTEIITKSYGPGDPDGVYCLAMVEVSERHRGDWLYANGLEMSSEERNMWKQLQNEVVDMFRRRQQGESTSEF